MSHIKERCTKKCHSDPRTTIDSIHTKLKSSLSKEEKDAYYLDNGILLDQYYSNNTNTSTSKTTGILNYFKNKETKPEDNKNINIVNKYLSNIDDTFIDQAEDEEVYTCKLCNSIMEYIMINSELVCKQCNYTEDIIINSEKNSYKDPPREISYFAYKRINHFNEWLAQFQAKESTEISPEIYTNIYKEIKKNINLDINKITPKQLRVILKKLEYNKYYEHIPHIINMINGNKAPALTATEEEYLRSLFKDIQIPFSNNCPETRKNFLSYSYVLHKFCELLEYDYLLPHFPLLKSREKLIQQDKIWKLICRDLNWQYIPSI